MTRRERIDQILDQHEHALQALRDASRAFDAAMDGLQATMVAIASANTAQGLAIDAALEANRAALSLLREDTNQADG